jgi:hypothetical protein
MTRRCSLGIWNSGAFFLHYRDREYDRRDGSVGPGSDLKLIASEPWLEEHLQLERNGALLVHELVRPKELDTARHC